MVGVNFRHLGQVDIFDLLGLNPFDSHLGSEQLRKAYRRVMLVAHPDKTGQTVKATQLNRLRDFLLNFDPHCGQIRPRIAELFRRGRDGWVSTWNPWLNPNDPGFWQPITAYSSRGHIPRPAVASKPGSSASNPIVIDGPEVGAQAPPAAGSSNRKGNFRTRTKSHRRCRKHRRSEYHPSQESKWRPAPYADESDTAMGWS
ncbi:MAG: hypothetical protein M1840_000641 [Geoglossum simile]|nr:MAG: hypothetical protein M1840_000641 [Geoglossum simile]